MSSRGRKRSARKESVPVAVGASPQRARHLLAALALCILALAAYSNSFDAGFVLDNKGLLLNDPRIREASPENLALILKHTYWWPTGEAGLYRPLTTLSWLFNYAILGGRDQPAGYHWVNFSLLAFDGVLLYAVASALIRRFWPAAFIAGIWVVHPALTESVTNIAGRADLLAAFGVLSGFVLYLKSSESEGLRRWGWLGGLTVVTAIGVLSKESAVAILPLLILYELTWWKTRRRSQALLFGCLSAALPIAMMLYQRAGVLAAAPPAEFPFTDNPIAGADWWTGRLTALKVICRYLWLTVWPAQLSADYSWNQIPLARGTFGDWLACLTVFAVLAGIALLYRWNRTAFFFACFGFVNLVPVSNLFFPIGTIMAERLLCLPAAGFVACLVLLVCALAQRAGNPRLAPFVLAVITTAFAVRTWARNPDWKTDLTLATATIRASPNSFKAHRLMAAALFESDPEHARIDQVIEEEERSLALLDPLSAIRSRADAYRVAGYYYLVKGDQMRDRGQTQNAPIYQKAIRTLSRAIAIDQVSRPAYRASVAIPAGDSEAYFLLSAAYLRAGDPAKALEAGASARSLNPLNPQIYRQLADVFAAQHREDESTLASTEAEVITDVQRGQWQEAAELSERVLQLKPGDFPSGYYLNAMANLHLGRLELAEKNAREAIRLDTEHRNPRTNYVLGLILAQKGDFRRSAEALRAYLDALPGAPDAETARQQLAGIEKSAAAAATP